MDFSLTCFLYKHFNAHISKYVKLPTLKIKSYSDTRQLPEWHCSSTALLETSFL